MDSYFMENREGTWNREKQAAAWRPAALGMGMWKTLPASQTTRSLLENSVLSLQYRLSLFSVPVTKPKHYSIKGCPSKWFLNSNTAIRRIQTNVIENCLARQSQKIVTYLKHIKTVSSGQDMELRSLRQVGYMMPRRWNFSDQKRIGTHDDESLFSLFQDPQTLAIREEEGRHFSFDKNNISQKC